MSATAVPAAYPWETGEPGSTAYLFLSAHLDDVALSCGGLIAKLSPSWPVYIATAFTGDAPQGSPISKFALRSLQSAGLDLDGFAVRRNEDMWAAEVLGAANIHLGMLDAIFRTDENGRPVYECHVVGSPIPSEDMSKTRGALADCLRTTFTQLSARFDRIAVFCCLGVGGHVDHLILRQAAEKVVPPTSLYFYVDFPYIARVQNGKAAHETQGMQSFLVPLRSAEISARVRASCCYRSQVGSLFPSLWDRILDRLVAEYPSLDAIQYLHTPRWMTAARLASAIMSRIRQDGGETYWRYVTGADSDARG